MSSSNSPCAACKFLRRKCTQGCVFSPYFPPDQPQKFANVHRVFGASNVAKLLNELSSAQREDAVNSLAYEAEARLRDPVYGCVGYISLLQHKLKQIQHDLYAAKKELATYIGPAALGPFLPPHHSPFPAPFHHQQQQLHGASASSMQSYGVPGIEMGLGLPATSQMLLREQQQQQIAALEAQQLAAVAAAAREQEILRSLEQQQQDIARFNTGFVDGRGFSSMGANDEVVVVAAGSGPNSVASPPSGLALASPRQFVDNPFHLHNQNQQQQQQLQLHQYMEHYQATQQQQQQRAGSEEGRSGIGPTS